MKYRRTLLTLAILGPMAVALSSCGTESTYAYNGAYPYDYPYPDGGFSSLGTTTGVFTTASTITTTTATTHGTMALGTIPAASTTVGPVVFGPGPACLFLTVANIVAETAASRSTSHDGTF